ncbi:hypothetical protein BJV77DRAFT_1064558 [Russula vinacea]|nr:hypothetical protein BJV77DRAFT_1064558 [Russula vinacea]
MPVQPPAAPAGVGQPAELNDPPTLENVKSAIQYSNAVQNRHLNQPEGASEDDAARGALYATNIMVAHNAQGNLAAAPAWFAGAVLQVINGPNEICDSIAEIRASLISMKRMDAKAWNIHCDDGHQRPYCVMPFLNGGIPTQPPHNLPELRNVDAIRGLDGPQSASYMNGYGLGYIHLIVERKRRIGQEIGCPVII